MYNAVIEWNAELGTIEGWLQDGFGRKIWANTVVVEYREAVILRNHFSRIDDDLMLNNYEGVVAALQVAIDECYAVEYMQAGFLERAVIRAIGRPKL